MLEGETGEYRDWVDYAVGVVGAGTDEEDSVGVDEAADVGD